MTQFIVIPQREVVQAIISREDFALSTGSMWGTKTATENGYIYEIKSYGVPIGRLEFDFSKANDNWRIPSVKWITDKKYSVTTSKHTNFVRRAFAHI